jgi:hypothetical protein
MLYLRTPVLFLYGFSLLIYFISKTTISNMKTWGIIILFLFPFAVKSQTITTVAGTAGSVIYDPQQLAFDRYGNLYIGGGLGNQIIKIDNTGLITVFAGTGAMGYGGDGGSATAAIFDQPGSITTDSFGNVYIGDAGNYRVRKVNIATGIVTTIAGNGSTGFGGDSGPATNASVDAISPLRCEMTHLR